MTYPTHRKPPGLSTSVYLTGDMARLLDEAAEQSGLSRSELIRAAVAAYLLL